MRRCDTEGCDRPVERTARLCGECWLAYADFLRDQEPDVVAEARAFVELADDEVEW